MENGSCILSVLNTTVNELNRRCCQIFRGGSIVCYSADSVYDADDHARFPTEFLNSLSVPGIPEHCLILKIGMPVMLLRNLSPSDGLCNGVRLIVTGVINKQIVSAHLCSDNNKVFLIPRINLVIDETNSVPLKWRRRQFPLTQAFSLTINKVQGQTLQKVGVWLENPVFSHGQFYTAASRVADPNFIRFYVNKEDQIDDSKPVTKNIVYREVL